MKALATLLWFLSASLAIAQTVVVKSGEHPGFTRLVLELPGVVDWQMGRTDEGYELRIIDAAPRYDLTDVFRNITRDRLSSIWMDPSSGGLHLGIGCACHAMPFELRPGIIVVDLRDGPAPHGSSFELTLAGTKPATLVAKSTRRPRARPPLPSMTLAEPTPGTSNYNWLATAPVDPKPVDRPLPKPLLGIVSTQSDLAPLKDALLRQLSQGAAEGIVQMALPNLASQKGAAPLPLGPRAKVHLGESPGFDVGTPREPDRALANGGTACVADDSLNVANWGSDLPVPVQLADSRANLIGEFDKPNADAVAKAVKLFLYLGFGAEAQQMLTQMPIKDPDSAMWLSMAKLVDGGVDTRSQFVGMEGCDTAAALWASFAMPQLTAGQKPRTAAILRAFSALPAHLRRGLGPDLAEKFLAVGDTSTARALGNAVERGLTEPSPDVAVMDASLEMTEGNTAIADATLTPLMMDAGPATAATLVALVTTRIAAGKAVDVDTPVVLDALIREQAGSDIEPALRRAQIFALGSLGDFDKAFALLPNAPDAAHQLWSMLAQTGPDTAILNHAVLASDGDVPNIPTDDRNQIASHLVDLGMPDAALVWIGPLTNDQSDANRIVAAKAALLQGDTQAALIRLAGVADNAAQEVRAQALWRSGKIAEAAKAWAEAGNAEADLRAQSWAQNWGDVAQRGSGAWQSAAMLVAPDATANPAPVAGPLAAGAALVTDSAATRATLAALLADVPGPTNSN